MTKIIGDNKHWLRNEYQQITKSLNSNTRNLYCKKAG